MKNDIERAYELIAPEYYNSEMHPTCANFRAASARFIWQSLYEIRFQHGWVCEIGAGKSVLLEFMSQHPTRFSHVVVIDSSFSMLDYSRKIVVDKPVYFVVGSAFNFPLPSNCLTLIVSSLGDPYNTKEFWNEAYRVLRPGGWIIFTIPDYEWVAKYRSNSDLTVAEFIIRGNHHHLVPSWVYPIKDQYELISHSKNEDQNLLYISKSERIPLSTIKSEKISPKLSSFRDPNLPIVSSYIIQKVY